MIETDYDVIIVIPIGPGSSIEFVYDTIQSYIYYTRSSYKFILLDDSKQGVGSALKKLVPDCDIVITRKALGGWAGLYVNLCIAFKHAIDRYEFKTILKLDTDALVIGAGPETAAIQLFKQNPLAGIAGQYPLEYNGQPWNRRWPERRILNSTRSWKFFRRPLANWPLIGLHNKALKNGYITGESVFGGAYFMGKQFLINLSNNGLLPKYVFQSLNLGEDHIFSLLAKAMGFSLESLSYDNGPVGCAWQGLPVSPEELIHDNRKIIHSVKGWLDMDENAIRQYFKSLRKEL